jgi:hypothetical protein
MCLHEAWDILPKDRLIGISNVMDFDDLRLLLAASLPFLISFIFMMLLVAGWMVARKCGALTAYVAFVAVIPVTAVVWLLGQGRFALFVILVSFVVGMVCLPLILYLNWRRLSPPKVAGVVVCGLLHSSPFFLFVFILVAALVGGK